MGDLWLSGSKTYQKKGLNIFKIYSVSCGNPPIWLYVTLFIILKNDEYSLQNQNLGAQHFQHYPRVT